MKSWLYSLFVNKEFAKINLRYQGYIIVWSQWTVFESSASISDANLSKAGNQNKIVFLLCDKIKIIDYCK